MADRLSGKTAIITGGSRGIGEAIAQAFCAEGAKVIICSRKQDGLDAAAARIRDANPDADITGKAVHAGKFEQIEAFFSWLDDQGITADILVNNAGTNPYFGPMMGVEDFGAWDKTFEVNLKGPFLMTREVCKRLLASNAPGSIINTSSIMGVRGAPFQGIYGASKAALISMTRTLALELGQAGIRVNAIAPGLVDTRLAAAITTNAEMTDMVLGRAAMKRVGKPSELSGVAVFLASDDSTYMTGEVLNVDGGFLAA